MIRIGWLGPLVLVACGPQDRDRVTVDASTIDTPIAVDSAVTCPPPPVVASGDVQLAPPFDTIYKVYDLGPVPGVPNALGGTVVRPMAHDKLLVAGASETTSGAIYEITVQRNKCGH